MCGPPLRRVVSFLVSTLLVRLGHSTRLARPCQCNRRSRAASPRPPRASLWPWRLNRPRWGQKQALGLLLPFAQLLFQARDGVLEHASLTVGLLLLRLRDSAQRLQLSLQ